MKRFYFLSTLVLSILAGGSAIAQDFSNKGKDFWVGYGYHQIMTSGNGQEMVLYFATDAVTTVTVSIPGNGYSQTYSNIPANTVFTSNPLPKAGAQDARLTSESVIPENKGIHIVADHPIVAYAHIYNASVSGATILFPTVTLGKEYYSVNYKNVSNSPNANCWFYVIACDTGTTTVEITPSANTAGHAAGVPFTVDLTQGQVYNLMGQLLTFVNPFTGVDLTGSKIRSISLGTGSCKRIAVFSGSGRISITCNGTSSSSDNYMVQAFPKTAWGKKYLTVPTSGAMPNNFFRVCVLDPTTAVTVNGLPIGVPLQGNFFYDLPLTSSPQKIEADQPILVAQYITSQTPNACGNGSPGDPETIYLSPVEQNINRLLWNATPNFAITQHFFNVVIPNTGTALTSFKLDGVPVSPALFTTHPQDAGFSYFSSQVISGQHTITSDSGFNAIAYGYGSAESYGYNAGTNVKDLYQFVTIQNQYATVNFPATCRNAPFYFSMTFPYQPTQIQWVFGPALNAMGIADVTIGSPVYDSTWFVNGRQLYRYKLATPYTITASGTYPIRVLAQNPTADGCSGEQEVDYDLQVFDPPHADYTFNNTGCATDTVFFYDATNLNGRTAIKWHWDFGDTGIDSVKNTKHRYSAPGSYNVKYSLITDVGCLSDTANKVITLSDPPIAKFGASYPYCVGRVVTFTDSSLANAGGTLAKWYWNFGDGSPQVLALNNAPQIHTYNTAGTYNATLKVETTTGCQSFVFTFPIIIHVNPVAAFSLPNAVCQPAGAAQFNDQSTISDGTQSLFTYLWNFGDGGTSISQNPVHNYIGTGPFNVTLTVTSNNGCPDDSIRLLNTVYAQPHADFTVDSIQSCLSGTVRFTDASIASNSSVTQWFWDFGDGTTSTQQNPTKVYAAPGTYTVKLHVTSAVGCLSDTMSKTLTVLQLPVVSFTNSTPLCETGNIQFTSTSTTNGGTFSQYTWTVNGTPAGGNSATLNYIPATAGNYTVQLTATTSNGCHNQNASSVTVYARPVASFNLPNVCLPTGTANFNSISTISDGTQAQFIYLWIFGDGGTATTQNPTHIYAGVGPFNVTLTVTSNHGCLDDSVRVLNTIYAEPQAAFNAPAEVCFGNVVNFTDQSTAAGSTVTQWNWNFGDGTTSTQQNPVKNYLVPGTYTIMLSVTSAIGCQTVNNIATKTVIVNPLPTSNFSTSVPSCETQSITFTDGSLANAGSLVKWTWNYGDGSNAVLVTGAPFNHVYATAGTYNVTLQVETNKSCVSTVLTKQVVVNAKPKAGFISPQICLTDPVAPFTDTSHIASGTIAGWNWNFGDGGTSTTQNPSHPYAAVGTYTATLIVTSNDGCKDTISNSFTVNGSVPIAGFAVQNQNTLCSNQTVNLTDASTVNFGSLIRIEIYWDFANDPTIKTIDNSPLNGRIYNHTYAEFGAPATKTYTIKYVAYSGITCVNTFTQNITLLATPTIQFDPVNPVCSNIPAFQITQAQLLNVLPGSGVFSGNGISPTGLFDPATAGTGMQTIRYTYMGTNGCSNYKEQIIEVDPTPIANAGPDRVVLEGGVVTLTPVLITGIPVSYLWTPSTGLNNPAIANAVASPPVDITYTLTVTSDKGCTTSDQVFVKVLKAPTIPNIFSPNGDGVHDRWEISYLESYPGCTVDVFNRYGQLIYHSIGYTMPWDGTVHGTPVPVGTYYYIVDPKNGRSKMTGYVDVIR